MKKVSVPDENALEVMLVVSWVELKDYAIAGLAALTALQTGATTAVHSVATLVASWGDSKDTFAGLAAWMVSHSVAMTAVH